MNWWHFVKMNPEWIDDMKSKWAHNELVTLDQMNPEWIDDIKSQLIQNKLMTSGQHESRKNWWH